MGSKECKNSNLLTLGKNISVKISEVMSLKVILFPKRVILHKLKTSISSQSQNCILGGHRVRNLNQPLHLEHQDLKSQVQLCKSVFQIMQPLPEFLVFSSSPYSQNRNTDRAVLIVQRMRVQCKFKTSLGAGLREPELTAQRSTRFFIQQNLVGLLGEELALVPSPLAVPIHLLTYFGFCFFF